MTERRCRGNASAGWTCVLPVGHEGNHIYSQWCDIAREAEAAIQRVRELCERQSFRATAEGYCVVMRVVETREVLRVLDGEQL